MTIHEAASEFDRTDPGATPGYQPIENYGIIGVLHTTALVGMDGSMGTQTTRAAQDDTGKIILTIATSEGERTLRSDKRDFIKANEILETTAPGVYTLGDVKEARPSRTSPRTTSASFAPTCWRVAAPPSRIPRSPTPCSQIRS